MSQPFTMRHHIRARPWPHVAAFVTLLALAACGEQAPSTRPDAAPTVDAGPTYPAPLTDVVPSLGTGSALELATWNIENFPKLPATPRFMADLITSLGLDLIAVQEIADITAFTELVDRLPNHSQLLSSHKYGNGNYQKVGFIYRSDLMTLTSSRLLFTNEGYNFPRPPLQATVTVTAPSGEPVNFTIIVVHLKAGFDFEDRQRREAAVALLEAYVRAQVDGDGDSDVIILGDFNEVLTSSRGRTVMGPWLDSPGAYRVHTAPLADADQASFIPTGVILDHVVTTASLADELAGGINEIPRLEVQFSAYEDTVSDHLPVVVSMPVLGL